MITGCDVVVVVVVVVVTVVAVVVEVVLVLVDLKVAPTVAAELAVQVVEVCSCRGRSSR